MTVAGHKDLPLVCRLRVRCSPLLLHGRETGVCRGAENNQNAHTRIRSFLLEKMSDMNVTHARPGVLFVVSLYSSPMASARVRDNHRQTIEAPFRSCPDDLALVLRGVTRAPSIYFRSFSITSRGAANADGCPRTRAAQAPSLLTSTMTPWTPPAHSPSHPRSPLARFHQHTVAVSPTRQLCRW